MVRGQYKSHSFRKIFVRTPGAKVVVHRRLPKKGAPTCPKTGIKLHGIPTGRPAKMRRMAKSKRVPSRAYGGVLSSSAARRTIKSKARSL